MPPAPLGCYLKTDPRLTEKTDEGSRIIYDCEKSDGRTALCQFCKNTVFFQYLFF